jgi:hypothetical protein
MKQYVIGNDIDDISWDIYAKHEVPENFDDATDPVVYAQHYYTPVVTIPATVLISGNRLKLVFLAADIRKTGVYDIVLEYKKPDLVLPGGIRNFRVTNCAAFEVVGKSCEVEVPEDPLVIEGIVAPLKGYSAYEVAVKKGFVGTEEEWLESLKLNFDDLTEDEIALLQQPARESATQAIQAASSANNAAQNANNKAAYAQTYGDYAKTQGDYAKEQGDYIASLDIITSTIVNDTEYNEIF